MLIPLDEAVRLISFQFSFSNADAVPRFVRQTCAETPEGREKRKSYDNAGVQLIPPTENCNLFGVLTEINSAGWSLVDAVYQERVNPIPGRKMYHMVRFVFAKPDGAPINADEALYRRAIASDFAEITGQAHWRVRGYSNPYFKDGEVVEGACAISVNMEVRVPRYRLDGTPVTQWIKDEDGNRLGNAPRPITADYNLFVNSAHISLGLATFPKETLIAAAKAMA